MRTIAAAALAATLAACVGPNPNLGVVDVNRLTPQRAAVRIVDSVPAGATVIGSVHATSCKNKIWDPDPSEANALAQLQIKAAELGAAAVAGVTYTSGGTSLVTNCWAHITATGTAVR